MWAGNYKSSSLNFGTKLDCCKGGILLPGNCTHQNLQCYAINLLDWNETLIYEASYRTMSGLPSSKGNSYTQSHLEEWSHVVPRGSGHAKFGMLWSHSSPVEILTVLSFATCVNCAQYSLQNTLLYSHQMGKLPQSSTSCMHTLQSSSSSKKFAPNPALWTWNISCAGSTPYSHTKITQKNIMADVKNS